MERLFLRRYFLFVGFVAAWFLLTVIVASCRQPNVAKQQPEKSIEQVVRELKLELGQGSVKFSRGISSVDIVSLGNEKVIRVRVIGDRATDSPNLPS